MCGFSIRLPANWWFTTVINLPKALFAIDDNFIADPFTSFVHFCYCKSSVHSRSYSCKSEKLIKIMFIQIPDLKRSTWLGKQLGYNKQGTLYYLKFRRSQFSPDSFANLPIMSFREINFYFHPFMWKFRQNEWTALPDVVFHLKPNGVNNLSGAVNIVREVSRFVCLTRFDLWVIFGEYVHLWHVISFLYLFPLR